MSKNHVCSPQSYGTLSPPPHTRAWAPPCLLFPRLGRGVARNSLTNISVVLGLCLKLYPKHSNEIPIPNLHNEKKRLASFVGLAAARKVLTTLIPFGAQSVRETAARTSRAGGRGASACSRYPSRTIAEDGGTDGSPRWKSIYGAYINLYYITPFIPICLSRQTCSTKIKLV
jgi:hypothetical protein